MFGLVAFAVVWIAGALAVFALAPDGGAPPPTPSQRARQERRQERRKRP